MRILIVSKKLIIFLIILLTVILSFLIFKLFKSPLSRLTNSYEYTSLSQSAANSITNLIKGNEKVCYLTFDDGPTPNVTPKVLDILKAENVKATFFVIGKYVDAYPEIVKRAYDEGHFIANHTYDHNNNVLYKSDENFINEIKKTDLAISNAIGISYSSHIFRFPNGYMSPNNRQNKKRVVELLPKINYTYIDWNCLNNDSVKKYSKEQLLSNFKKSVKNKNTLVVLMHDTKFASDSSMALKDSIEYLKSLGYSFKNFYDLF